MEHQETPLTPHELGKKLHQADDNPYLSYDALVEACEQIFGERTAISYEEFQEKTKAAYQIDMDEYAQLHNFIDSVKLVEYFAYLRAKIEAMISRHKRTDRIILIGCGQGRLANVYISLAKKLQIKEITFNDLLEKHIHETEQRIKTLYGTDGQSADGIKISYLPGDIATIDVSGLFDAAVMWWYVSAEFCDPGSIENMRKIRDHIYAKINEMLVPGGGLIEDIPDPNMTPGFYQIANFKTAYILKERGILPGEHKNLLLSNWTSEQDAGFPYQLRYVAKNGSDMREKEKAGFELVKSESLPLPKRSVYKNSQVVIESLQDADNIWEAIKILNKMLLDTVTFPDGDQIDQKRRKISLWGKI